MNLTYEFKDASIYDLREVNSSFASGKLRVLYTGANRNGSYISREAVEAALPTLYNVPIVCHYMPDENLIGGHDVSLEKDEDGNVDLVNLTEPCGVVPEHAKFRFVNDCDADGNEHEYLEIDGVILWKRQRVYKHITEDLDSIVKHSMEITVRDGGPDQDSGLYNIKSFEFTALCLLESCEPCFQGSQLELYSVDGFKEQMAQMMAELKEAFTMIASSAEDDDTNSHNHSREGGMTTLPEKIALVEQYGLTVEELGFSIDEMTEEELRMRLEDMARENADPVEENPAEEDFAAEPETVEEPAPEEDPAAEQPEPEEDPAPAEENFALAGQIAEDLMAALRTEKVETPWGEDYRYWFWDYDAELMEVYCTDCTDWLLYGFSYSMSGDAVTINFESKKRMKLVPVDYVDGNEDRFSLTIKAVSDKYSDELTALKEFKLGVEQEALNEKRNEVLDMFSDLNGIEAFEAVKENVADYTPDDLEEKCYAIRGRYGAPAKFSFEQKKPKLPINVTEQADEPYGGLFVKYNVGMTN